MIPPSPLKTYGDFRKRVADGLMSWECAIRPPEPLVRPEIPTNFTMSLAVTLKPEPLPGANSSADYGMIQPCLRIHDASQVLLDPVPWHLTFFEMAGVVLGGSDARSKAFRIFFDLCESVLGLKRSELTFDLFAGGGAFSQGPDEPTQACLLSLGIDKRQLRHFDRNYFGQREGEVVAGPMIEVHLSAPGGELKELATLVILEHSKRPDGTLLPAGSPVAEFGFGLERAFAMAQGNFNLSATGPMSETLHSLADFKDSERLLIADRLRAVVFAVAAGASPGRSGRSKVVRQFLRDIFDLIGNQNLLEHCFPAIKQIVNSYKEPYPQLDEQAVIEAMIQEYGHDKKRRERAKE